MARLLAVAASPPGLALAGLRATLAPPFREHPRIGRKLPAAGGVAGGERERDDRGEGTSCENDCRDTRRRVRG
jgi:hypothetical protein